MQCKLLCITCDKYTVLPQTMRYIDHPPLCAVLALISAIVPRPAVPETSEHRTKCCDVIRRRNNTTTYVTRCMSLVNNIIRKRGARKLHLFTRQYTHRYIYMSTPFNLINN